MAASNASAYFEHPRIKRLYGEAMERLLIRGQTSAGMIAWESCEVFYIAWIVECRLRHYGWIGDQLNQHGEYPLIRVPAGFG
jgi:hypothetical protein